VIDKKIKKMAKALWVKTRKEYIKEYPSHKGCKLSNQSAETMYQWYCVVKTLMINNKDLKV